MDTILTPPSEEMLLKAADIIRAGGLVGFPTETVYGLGGDATNESAVRAIFHAKGRPADNPLIVHVADAEKLPMLCRVTQTAERLISAFWPGPLTLLMQKTPLVPDVTTAGLASVAVRCPAHPIARRLIALSGTFIAAPSANLSGRPSPTTAAHVYADMKGRIPMILDGGACQVGVESTVCDLTGDVPVILRPGAVTRDMIASEVGDCLVAGSVMRPLREGESAPSPGMKHRHYAPKGKLTIVRGEKKRVIDTISRLYDQADNACILCGESRIKCYRNRICRILGDTPEEAENHLFTLLREMDDRGIAHIFAEGFAESDDSLAVMNRMARAAAFDIIDV